MHVRIFKLNRGCLEPAMYRLFPIGLHRATRGPESINPATGVRSIPPKVHILRRVKLKVLPHNLQIIWSGKQWALSARFTRRNWRVYALKIQYGTAFTDVCSTNSVKVMSVIDDAFWWLAVLTVGTCVGLREVKLVHTPIVPGMTIVRKFLISGPHATICSVSAIRFICTRGIRDTKKLDSALNDVS